MLVLEIKEEVYHSTKNGKDYLSYPIRYGIEREVNGQKVMQLGYCKLANSNSIQKLIAKGKIKTYKDLEGKEVELFRSFPVYLSDAEKKQGQVFSPDTLVLLG